MEANASSLTALGRLWVIEMGRWREKNAERARDSLGKFCVLGTDGRAASVVRPVDSLERLFRFSEVDEDLVDCAGRERLAGMFLGSLSGLEGFDDEYLLW